MTRVRSSVWILAGLLIVLLFMRLAVLLTYSDKLYEPEELYRGTIAHEIIGGKSHMPLWDFLDYKTEYFPGGTLVVGFMAVPFFLLLGQTYISLKLVGLLFALVTCALWFLFIQKYFNRRAAVFSVLLFIFCVPLYTKTSLITWGAHPEANLFTIISIFLFFDIIYSDLHTGRKALALGIVSGFGMWFVQTYLLTIAYIFMLWLVFDTIFFARKKFLFFVIGAVIGFSPGIYYELFYHGSVLNINGKPVVNNLVCGAPGIFFSKLWTLLSHDLPQSFLFPGTLHIPAAWYSWAYYAVFLGTCAFIAWQEKRQIGIFVGKLAYPVTLRKLDSSPQLIRPALLLLVYPFFFFICYAISGFSVSPGPWEDPQVWLDYIGFRYMIPVVPFIFAIMGIGIATIKNRTAARFLLGLVIFCGVAANMSMIIPANFGRFLTDKGFSYNIIGDKIGLRITSGLSQYIRPFAQLDRDLRRQFFEGLGAGIAWRLREREPREIIAVFNSEVEKKYHPFLYRGWGTLFFPGYPAEFATSRADAEVISNEFRPFFWEGVFKNSDVSPDVSNAIGHVQAIDRLYRSYCYTGLGYSIGFEFRADAQTRRLLTQQIDPVYRGYVEQGIAQGMRER